MFERKLWTESFRTLPSWPCPKCDRGQLVLIENSLRSEEPKWSKDAMSHEAWEPEWIAKRFSAHFECSDKSCGEGAVVIGTARGETDYGYDENGRTEISVDFIYYPEFIHPSPILIATPEEAHEDIKKEITQASALVWTDVASSANKLRQAAERVLTELGVKKTRVTKKGKRQPIFLNERIRLIEAGKPEIASLLHSIRFLGNQGSHDVTETVDRNDLLSAFEIMERILDLAFSTKAKRTLKAAKDIQRRKGKPVKKGRRRKASIL
jgi:hypothetical protein